VLVRLRSAGLVLLAALLLAGTEACKRKRSRGWEVEQPAPVVAEEDQAELEALGYVEFDAAAAPGARAGAIIHAAQKLLPGYYLVGLSRQCAAQLYDARGQVVHAWGLPDCSRWRAAELAPGGDLLVLGMDPPGTTAPVREYVARLRWSGELLWKRSMVTHHDVEARLDGSILVLTLAHARVPEYEAPILDDRLTFLDADGNVTRELSMYGMVVRNRLGFVPARVEARRGTVDVLHTNSVASMDRAELSGRHPLYRLGNVLVASRRQNAVFVFDPDAAELRFVWGPGSLDGPHDATLLPSGNILLFDNGWHRGRSRVLELDPIAGRIVWEYPGRDGRDFYSKSRGSAQRLANGNTLIGNSNTGQALEVDPGGRPVWELSNPVTDGKGHRAVILRIRHHAAAVLAPLLGGR
jgi:hypothetical protein